MSGLFASLNSSIQALAAQSQALDIAGKNLANVNNPAYSRESVLLGSLGTIVTAQGPESMGLTVLAVQQTRDALVDQQRLEFARTHEPRVGQNLVFFHEPHDPRTVGVQFKSTF